MDENTPVTTKTLSTSNSYAVSGKIMLITVIVSFSVSILILLFHFYYRYSNLNRHPTPDHQGFAIRNRALTSKGLSQSVLQSLPVFLYSAAQDPLECAICLSEFQQNQSGRILPKCSHVFHLQCIDTWFVSHPDCPLCRAKVQAPNITGCDSQSEDASGSYLNASGSSSIVRISSPVPELAIDIPTETSETGSGTSENGGPYAS